MKNRLLRVFIVFFSLIPLQDDAGVFYSGSDLFAMLQYEMTGKPSHETFVATGYISGVFDAYSDEKICAPSNVKIMQVKQMVYNYMKANPQFWHATAESNVLEALREVWPCEK